MAKTLPRLLIATANPQKVAEIRHAFEQAGLAMDLVMPPSGWDVEETGQTFADNATIKVLALAGQPWIREQGIDFILGDDSGYCIDALAGRYGLTPFPGIHANRWLTSARRQEILGTSPNQGTVSMMEKCLAILQLMQGQTNRRACFECALALLDVRRDNLPLEVLTGTMPLWVSSLDGPRGDQGFGYDPINHPLDPTTGVVDSRTVAELSPTEKLRLSHRGQAVAQVIARLQTLLVPEGARC